MHDTTEQKMFPPSHPSFFSPSHPLPSGHMSVEDVMSSSLSLHQSVVCCEEGRVQLLEEEGPGDEGAVTPETGVFRRAVIRLMCASYRNQAMHVFVRPTLVIMAMASVPSSKKG